MEPLRPRYDPNTIPGCAVLTVLIGVVLGMFWQLGALSAPGYHIITITPRLALFVLRFFRFEIGLFEVHAEARNLAGNLFRKNVIGRAQHKMAKALIESTDGASLAHFASFVCGLDASLYWQLNLPCDRLQTLFVASNIMAGSFIMSVILLTVAMLMLLMFWFFARTIRTRQAFFLMLFFAGMMTFFGILQYLLLVGPQSSFGVGNWFSDVFVTEITQPMYGMGPGFAVAAGSMMWTVLLPFWAMCALPKSYCDDYEADDRLEYEETEALISKLEEAARGDW
eukprot:Polyplicarium_translucidae@DN65_c0_g1_i1.p1